MEATTTHQHHTIAIATAGLGNTADTARQNRAVEAYLLQRMLAHTDTQGVWLAERRQGNERRRADRLEADRRATR